MKKLVFILFLFICFTSAAQKYTAAEIIKLFQKMEDENLSIDSIIKIIDQSNIQNVDQSIQDIKFVKNKDVQKEIISDNVKLIIDYTKTIKQIIEEAEGYEWKNDEINDKNFPIPLEMIGKKVEVSAKLFHFNRRISLKSIISEMDKAGYRQANLIELLTLRIIYPELQARFPITTLGFIWRGSAGDHYSSYSQVVSSRYRLDFDYFSRNWGLNFYFIGIQK